MNLIEKYVLLKKVKNYVKVSNDWFDKNLSKPNLEFREVTPNYLRVGGFYYFDYDPNKINKSTKIEQKSIVFIVDYKPLINTKIIRAINFNFLPSNIRTLFFLKLLGNTKYDAIFNSNDNKKDWLDELPISGISEDKIIREFIEMFGTEGGLLYTKSIRSYHLELLNKIYGISTKNLDKLISLDVKPISGMDDVGIIKVLKGKLKNEGVEGLQKELYQVKSNYEEILKDLQERFKYLEKILGKI
jgi:hypothetical protein